MTDTERRNLEEPTVYADPDAPTFSDGLRIGFAVAGTIAIGLALLALGAAIYCGEI